MKRLLAVVATMSLLASSAFAQAFTLSGSLYANTTLLGGNSEENSFAKAGPTGLPSARIQADLGNSDLGGRFRVFTPQAGGNDDFAFIWWRPMQQLRLQIGRNPDGDWGGAQISGWGFNGDAQDSVAVDNDDLGRSAASHARGSRVGFYPGFSARGATISIFPIPALTINLAIPFGAGVGGQNRFIPNEARHAGEAYSRLHAQVRYDLDGLGQIRVSAIGGIGYWNPGHDFSGSGELYEPTRLYASFFLTSLRESMGMELDFGLAWAVPVATDGYSPMGEGTLFAPIQLGVGFRYDTPVPNLHLRARLGMSFAGSFEPEGNPKGRDTVNGPFAMGIGILPRYDLGFMRVFFNAGLGIAAVSDYKKMGTGGTLPGSVANGGDVHPQGWNIFATNKEDVVVSFFVNPYVDKAIGQARVWGGFKLWSDGRQDSNGDLLVNWAVPIGMQFNF